MGTKGIEVPVGSRSGGGTISTVGVWALQLLLAANFFFAGGGKLAGMEQMVVIFDEVGIGQWFRYLTGLLEVGGALLLLIPGTVVIGALVLAAVMVGAVVAEVWVLAGNPVMPLVLLILLSLVAYLRRDVARRSRAPHQG